MRIFVAAFAAALLLSACQDPAGVGLGLIDEEQLDPNVRTIALTDLTVVPDTSIAIGLADGTNVALAQTRVFVGRVVDAQFGDARSVAYVDFLQSAALDGDATAADVSQVWLDLPRAYLYGDTTTVLPLDLRAIQGTWSADTGYPADTLFATGDVLATTTVTVADTLTRFDLPASWVTANAATLIGDDFVTAFEGFSIDVSAGFTASPGALVGYETFASAGAGLRVVVGEDTLAYALSEVFSSIATETPPMPPAGVLPIRAGSGTYPAFAADFASIGASALARARLRLPIDASFAEAGAFVRPIASRSFLFGVREGDNATRILIAELTVANGELLTADTSVLTPTIQQVLLNPTLAFDRYEIAPARGTASFDIIPLILPGNGTDPAPRFTLTVVGASG